MCYIIRVSQVNIPSKVNIPSENDSCIADGKAPPKLSRSELPECDCHWYGCNESCLDRFLDRWYDKEKDEYIYPPADGYVIDRNYEAVKQRTTIKRGTLLDRFGDEDGRHLAPYGTPWVERALPPSLDHCNGNKNPHKYRIYRANKDFAADEGPSAPWFEQHGYGIHYQLEDSIVSLVDQGILERMEHPDQKRRTA